MAKLTVNNIGSGYLSTTALNDNFDLIEVAIENTLSRDGTGPNQMEANLDMNGNLILNQGNPVAISGFTWEGPWVTTTNYSVGDIVEQDGTAYMAIVEHLAGVFATDLAEVKWQLFASSDLPSQVTQTGKYLRTDGSSLLWDNAETTASNVSFTQVGVGGIVSTVQDKQEQNISASDFGALADGVTNDTAAITYAKGTGKSVYIPKGTYAASEIPLSFTPLLGEGPSATTLIANGTTEVLQLGFTNTPSQWAYKNISGITVDGNGKTSNGVSFEAATNTQISGRWSFNDVVITDCLKGISKPTGNIGNAFYNITLTGNDYGYYAESQVSPAMHAGADFFIGGEISGNALAGIYIDSSLTGTGGTSLRNTIVENNAGFGIFVKNWATSYTPLVFDSVWFEGNATSGSVTVNGTGYTPHDIYLENARHVVLQNGVVPDIQLINSNLTIENSFLTYDYSAYNIDGTSSCTANNVNIDGGAHPIEIHKAATCYRPLGNFAARFRGKPRSPTIESSLGTVLQSITYATANSYSFPGTTTVTATSVADGVIFDSCADLIIPAGNTQNQTSFSITSGNWYLFSLDVKHISGTLADLSVVIADSGTAWSELRTLMKNSGWTTLVGMGRATSSFTARLILQNTGAGSLTERLSAFQVMEFTSEQQMLEYYNSGAYSTGTAIPSETFSTIAPTTGTWEVGDHCTNRVKVVGQPKGWFCTVAGTPGTWVSEGNL